MVATMIPTVNDVRDREEVLLEDGNMEFNH